MASCTEAQRRRRHAIAAVQAPFYAFHARFGPFVATLVRSYKLAETAACRGAEVRYFSHMHRHLVPTERLALALATSRAVRAEIARDIQRARQQLPRRQHDLDINDLLMEEGRFHAQDRAPRRER
jgi:hypothetical protein